VCAVLKSQLKIVWSMQRYGRLMQSANATVNESVLGWGVAGSLLPTGGGMVSMCVCFALPGITLQHSETQ
jgi:hypothetical protein